MQPPQSPNIWYLIGRGIGETTVRGIDAGTGAFLWSWERAVRVRRIFSR